MKKFVSLFLILGLFISLSHAPNVSADDSKGLVKVKLMNAKFVGNKTSIDVDVVGKYIVDSDRRSLTGTGFEIKAESGKLNLYKGSTLVKSYGSTFSIHPDQYGTSNYIVINGWKYTGVFDFVIEGNYVRPINSLLMDDYLKGVTPFEMSGDWNVATLKAGTLAARTYAMRNAGKTLVDTQANQVYGGYTWYDNSNRAVNETVGEVIKYNSNLIEALYSSSNGGMILSNTNTWGTDLRPYFLKKEDPYDLQSGTRFIDWSYAVKKKQIDLTGKDLTKPELWWSQVKEVDSTFMNNLKAALIKNKQLASNSDIKITNVTALNFKTEFTSNDVLTGYIDIEYYRKKTDTNEFITDSAGSLYKHKVRFEAESYDIRNLVGTSVMASAYVKSVVSDADKFTVNGGGFGHSIGMSQWGAKVMGDQGKSYRDILSFYYPNTDIVKESYGYPSVSMNGVSADVASPQSPNTPITISADASGGYDKVYRFYVLDGTEWKLVQDYSTKSTYTWTPTDGGDYKFSVHVKDKYSTKNYDDYSTLNYKILSSVKMNGVTADKLSPQYAETTINVTANAEGGQAKLYKFNLLKDGVWRVVQDFTSQNTFSWTPTETGDYKFSVHVKDAGSSKPYDDYGVLDYKITSKAASTDPVVMQSVTADKLSPQLANTAINLTAKATGGKTKLYKFNIFDGKTWKVTQNYSTKNTYKWVPAKAGSYKVSVHVKDQSSTKSYDSYKAFNYKITSTGQASVTPISIQNVVTDKVSPQPANSSVKVTANASGGTTKQYKFWVQKDGGDWIRVQDYTTNNSYNWMPSSAGSYKINVHVKDVSSTRSYDTYKVIDYVVTKGSVDMQSVKANLVSPQLANKAITVTATATGGESLLYKFNIYDGVNWIVLKDYSSANTLNWIPTKSGDYKFSVHVKDAKSGKPYDDYGVMYYKIN